MLGSLLHPPLPLFHLNATLTSTRTSKSRDHPLFSYLFIQCQCFLWHFLSSLLFFFFKAYVWARANIFLSNRHTHKHTRTRRSHRHYNYRRLHVIGTFPFLLGCLTHLPPILSHTRNFITQESSDKYCRLAFIHNFLCRRFTCIYPMLRYFMLNHFPQHLHLHSLPLHCRKQKHCWPLWRRLLYPSAPQ